MGQAYFYSNTAVDGTLGATIASGATSMFLSSTPAGYPGSFPFKLVIDSGLATEEIVRVNSGSGTSGTPWQITRAWDGTTAQSHNSGAAVGHRITAEDETLSRLHEALSGSASNAHGLPASAWAAATIAALDETTFSNSSTSAITWSSIPGGYKHLLIIAQGKFTEATQQVDNINVTINGDSGAFYSYVTQSASNVSGASTGALVNGSFVGSGTNGWPLIAMAGSQAGGASRSGGGWAIIPNYASTTFSKGFYSHSGAGDGPGAMADMRIRSGWYNPTVQAAITSITLTAPGGSNFVSGSFLGLYGIG